MPIKILIKTLFAVFLLFSLARVCLAEGEHRFGVGFTGDLYLHFLPTKGSMLSARILGNGRRSELEGESITQSFSNVLLEYRQYYRLTEVKKFYFLQSDNWLFYSRSKNADQVSSFLDYSMGLTGGFGLEKELGESVSIDGILGIAMDVDFDNFRMAINGPFTRVMLNYFW